MLFSATSSSPVTYYRSFERYYRGDLDAVEIVGIGSGEAEIFAFQVESIELVGCSGGRSLCAGESRPTRTGTTYEWLSRRQGLS